MTRSPDYASEKKFVPVVLPWLVAGLVLLVYLLTLNHWVSIASLGTVADISGWRWQPVVDAPLYWLVTVPFRWLPPRIIPVALNLLSAVCATLTLALLARSVALLPHDRTEEQRLREKSPFALLSISTAWVPPVLAVLACGLQLTFWQSSTNASREMFDLLLFAYIVRCFLEFRITGRDTWLFRASLVYGAAMAENWAMIGFFPLLLVALVWLKGVSFFDGRFLGRMFGLGSVGLAAYLVLPLVIPHTSIVPLTFWQVLKANLASQKQALLALPFNKGVLLHGFTGNQPLWVLALPSLIPLLALSIRWPSYFGDPSKLGVTLATLCFHILYAVLLVVCVWVALDPEKFSPRHLIPGLPLLTFYYLGALCVGYYVGYFLLVFGGTKPQTRIARPLPAYRPLLNFAVSTLVWLLVLAAPAALLYRNLPQIRAGNGGMWRDYADQLIEPLPSKGAVVMSDDLPQLFLARAALARTGRDLDYMFLDTGALRNWQLYHKYLSVRYVHRWPANAPPLIKDGPDAGKVNTFYLVQLAAKMAETNSIYYLHPSFGYYFEVFYPEPHQLIYKLQTFAPNSFAVPPCTTEQVGANEKFWTKVDDNTFRLLAAWVQALPPDAQHKLNWADKFLRRAHLVKEPNDEALFLAKLYSRDLVDWGVTMQRGGYLTQAATHFNRALDLNPENVVAQIDLECNKSLQAHEKAVVDLPKSAEERITKYRTLENVMNANGPFDEPTFCLQQGRVFLRGGNFRQAGQLLLRVRELVPDNLACRLLLAQIYLFSRMPDPALSLVDEIHRLAPSGGLDRTNQLELLSVETVAHLAKGDVAAADSGIRRLLEKYPADDEFPGVAGRCFMNFGYYSNAVSMFDLQLKVSPGNPGALINKGVALLRLNRFTEAIPPLSEVISSAQTNNFQDLRYAALINRAIAYLHNNELDKSQGDYRELQRGMPGDYRLEYGLGEIAYRKKDTNAAVQCYENYLRNAPNAPEIQNETAIVLARLKELKGTPGPAAPPAQSDSLPQTATNSDSRPGK